MTKNVLLVVCLLTASTPALFAGVTVNSPANNSTVPSPVNYVASATTSSCSKGIASMGIYSAPGVLAYVVNGSSLNTNLNLNAGTYKTTVEAWDKCGGAETTPIDITVSGGGGANGVHVTSPLNNSTVSDPVNFTATATTSCPEGVASMGIYSAPNQLVYTVNGDSMNYDLTLNPGTYNTTVEEWDKCGGAATTPITITVSGGGGGGGGGNSFYNLQHSGGWGQFGQGPPNFVDCSPSPCDGITFWMKQGITSPSMDGKTSEFYVGGSKDYSDALYNNHLIGPESSQGMPDNNHTLVPTLHDFTYDVYFYMDDVSISQAVEFDINQFFDSMGFIFGHECRIAGGNEWDVYDNQSKHWVHTGIPCYPKSNYWNHVTLKVQRTSNNDLVFQSITLNGVTNTLNWTYGHGSAPSSWYGVTINYQMDGNYKQQGYDVYLDELTFDYQ
jgi:major membrane immunogen (membrane-anchored lipoprotein)